MKHIYTLIVLIALGIICAAQPPRHPQPISRNQQADFYQSPLMDKYNIHYMKLNLSVTTDTNFISGSCLYRVTTSAVLDTFAIELMADMIVDSALVDGTRLPFRRSFNHIFIPLPAPTSANQEMTIEVVYKGFAGFGVYHGYDASIQLKTTATLSECFEARAWFPAKQLLNDKIDSADIWLTVPAPNIAGSNGLLKAVVALPGNKTQYQWSTRYPMNYYMPAFSVGNFTEYKNYAKPAAMNGDSLLIQHLLSNKPGYLSAIKNYLEMTPKVLEKYSELFGLYPFSKEKYGHMQTIGMDGEEHQTMTSTRDFSPYVIVHELAHQWFGDLVTCGSWQDIWLNEGLATYADYLMTYYFSSFLSNTPGSYMSNMHNDVFNAVGGSVYLPASGAFTEGRIFDPTLSYYKELQ